MSRLQPRSLAVLLLPLALVLAWDLSGLDLWLARLAGGSGGFPWREHPLLTVGLHQGGKALSWAAALWLATSLRWPTGVLRRLPLRRRAWLGVAVLGGLLLVTLAKHRSQTSCPWDLQAFGGAVPWVSHWAWRVADGGPGHCFPAGHASAGFAWLAGWFAWRDVDARVARRWLLAALAAGLVLGLGQQWRGAHFASHTLWTAWLCWAWAWCGQWLLPAPSAPLSRPARRPAAGW